MHVLDCFPVSVGRKQDIRSRPAHLAEIPWMVESEANSRGKTPVWGIMGGNRSLPQQGDI